MSLILDALKRAERERQAPASAALGELPPPRARRGVRIPWRALMVVALVGVAFAGWKKFHKPRPTTTAAVQPATPKPAPPAPIVASPAPAPAPAPVAPSAQTPIIASPPRAPYVIPGTEGMTSLEEIAQGEPEPELAQPAPAPAPQPKPATPAPAPKAATPAPKPPAPAPQAAPAQPATATPPPSAAIEEEPAEAPAEPAAPAPEAAPAEPPREISPALTQPAPYRKLKEMPPEYRADFPQVTIEVHVYQQIPAQRFVIINGRRYRQGDTLAEGPQIVEIVPEGVVVDYRNERLLLPIAR